MEVSIRKLSVNGGFHGKIHCKRRFSWENHGTLWENYEVFMRTCFIKWKFRTEADEIIQKWIRSPVFMYGELGFTRPNGDLMTYTSGVIKRGKFENPQSDDFAKYKPPSIIHVCLREQRYIYNIIIIIYII